MTDRVGGLSEPPFVYLDYHLAAMICRGLPDAEIADRLMNETCFAPYADQALEKAISALRERENRVLPGEASLSVRVTDLVEGSFRSKLLAHTYNHPTIVVFDHIVNEVLATSSILSAYIKPRESYAVDPLNSDRFVVPQFAREAYDLTFEAGREYALNDEVVSLEQYIAVNRTHFEQEGAEKVNSAIELLSSERPWFKSLLNLS